MALSGELTALKLGLRISGPWNHWIWSESGPEKADGGGSRVTVRLGRAGHGAPSGGERVGALGLGGAQGHLDFKAKRRPAGGGRR